MKHCNLGMIWWNDTWWSSSDNPSLTLKSRKTQDKSQLVDILQNTRQVLLKTEGYQKQDKSKKFHRQEEFNMTKELSVMWYPRWNSRKVKC